MAETVSEEKRYGRLGVLTCHEGCVTECAMEAPGTPGDHSMGWTPWSYGVRDIRVQKAIDIVRRG